MKLLFLGLLLTALSVNICYSQNVGKVVNGKPTLTTKKAVLIKQYEKWLLANSRIKSNFNKVAIKKVYGKNGVKERVGYYILVFHGDSIKSSALLKNKMGKLSLSGTSCTTSDCASSSTGCHPKLNGACSPCPNNGKCTRTSSSGFNPSTN